MLCIFSKELCGVLVILFFYVLGINISTTLYRVSAEFIKVSMRGLMVLKDNCPLLFFLLA